MAALFTELAALVQSSRNKPYDYAIIDECQDVSIPQLRFLGALGGARENGLFFSGDTGQQIFQTPFSWKSAGVDVRGRSFTLRINYRTSHQIRIQADRLLGVDVSDVDGNVESRSGTTSTFNGPTPSIIVAADRSAETSAIASWLREQVQGGSAPGEIAVFVRSPDQFDHASRALNEASIPFITLDERLATVSSAASICTMHLVKGLEFRTVAVIGCDEDVIPLRSRIESAADESELEEVYASERRLLYVACTRARDNLLVSAASPASEFIDDLKNEISSS